MRLIPAYKILTMPVSLFGDVTLPPDSPYKTGTGLHPIFDGVIIGPRQEQNLAVDIARMVFAIQGIHRFPPPPANVIPASLAQPSRIPYRMWKSCKVDSPLGNPP